MDLNSLARTLAEQAQQNLDVAEAGGNLELTILEAVIREAIEKTLDAPILREAISDISHLHDCPMQYIDGELDPDNCQRCLLEHAIRSLKQSNSGMEVTDGIHSR